MNFSHESAEVYVPDGLPIEQALARTTHLGIGAHQDDLEIMCLDGILAGFGSREKWFCGVVVTDGRGSPRMGPYADFTDEQMMQVRRLEQKKAAFVGEYGAQVFMDHPSSAVKDPANPAPAEDLTLLLQATRPEIVYIHNLADKHPTHIGVSMHTIRAIRALPLAQRPNKLYGCEVWRDLDWLLDSEKVQFSLDQHENLAMSLVGVFDSQIAGGKRYDLATMGRRRANATYRESHAVDQSQSVSFAMDLSPLIQDDSLSVRQFVLAHIDRFHADVDKYLEPFE